jgi:hypothetical protein
VHSAIPERYEPALDFLAAITLSMDEPVLIGDAPDGVRVSLCVYGDVAGPRLQARFARSSAPLLVDADGIGTLRLQLP